MDVNNLKALTEAGLEKVVARVNQAVDYKNALEADEELVALSNQTLEQLQAGGLSVDMAQVVFDTMAALKSIYQEIKARIDAGELPPNAV